MIYYSWQQLLLINDNFEVSDNIIQQTWWFSTYAWCHMSFNAAILPAHTNTLQVLFCKTSLRLNEHWRKHLKSSQDNGYRLKGGRCWQYSERVSFECNRCTEPSFSGRDSLGVTKASFLHSTCPCLSSLFPFKPWI